MREVGESEPIPCKPRYNRFTKRLLLIFLTDNYSDPFNFLNEGKAQTQTLPSLRSAAMSCSRTRPCRNTS